MECRPQSWGGNKVRVIARAGGALVFAAIATAGALTLNRNNRTPLTHGGWRELSPEDLEQPTDS